jgi:hypothetical protein
VPIERVWRQTEHPYRVSDGFQGEAKERGKAASAAADLTVRGVELLSQVSTMRQMSVSVALLNYREAGGLLTSGEAVREVRRMGAGGARKWD